MIENLIKFCHKLMIQKPISATITSSIPLVTTKTTYEIFSKYLKPNHEKISSYKQLWLKKWTKSIYFWILQKHINLI